MVQVHRGYEPPENNQVKHKYYLYTRPDVESLIDYIAENDVKLIKWEIAKHVKLTGLVSKLLWKYTHKQLYNFLGDNIRTLSQI